MNVDNKKTRDQVTSYLINNVVSDFSTIPTTLKLTYLQETPKRFIKQRIIDKNKGISVPYIDHFYAERALNFISNFNWGSEKISSVIEEKTVGGKKVFDAIVELKMWIYIGDKKTERYIASGHRSYENPAITKADALQSAISKANTKFARQFGIGANVIADEETAYDRVEKYYVDVEVIDEDRPTMTDEEFANFIDNEWEYILQSKHKFSFTEEQKATLNAEYQRQNKTKK